jgi:hypothetical protein
MQVHTYVAMSLFPVVVAGYAARVGICLSALCTISISGQTFLNTCHDRI